MQIANSNVIKEAKRQASICNACRYCEGFCNVFPELHKLRNFEDNDIIKLANICHNCRGCYYACQYAEPHEFNVNIPKAFAEVRQNSWEEYSQFNLLTKTISMRPIVLLISIAILLIFFVLLGYQSQDDVINNFYDIFSHQLLINIFIPLFVVPYILLGFSLYKFWKVIEGGSITIQSLLDTFKEVSVMKNLNGGHGDGCQFEKGDIYTQKRRYAHHLIAYGFLLCFIATSSATILHYIFHYPAPYPLFSLPKLSGLIGGLMMVIGCLWMLLLKFKSNRNLANIHYFSGEVAFILLLFATSFSGLLLYILKDIHHILPLLLYSHLALVACLFITTPFTKMTHIFYRFLAILHTKQ